MILRVKVMLKQAQRKSKSGIYHIELFEKFHKEIQNANC